MILRRISYIIRENLKEREDEFFYKKIEKPFFSNICYSDIYYIYCSNVFSVVLTAEDNFMAVGNIKIVRPEPLLIKREDLNITIEKNRTIKVNSVYTFENIGNYNVKSTFMFWLDTNVEKTDKKDFSNKNTNNRGKFVKNIKFLTDYKKAQSLRAVINFDESIYENQVTDNIQREWFAISKVIPSMEEGKVAVYYDLINTKFSRNKDFVYSFDLVENFFNKNKAEVLYVNIYNKSDLKIKNIDFKGYEFKNISKNNKKEHYQLLEGGVNLDGKLVIKFE